MVQLFKSLCTATSVLEGQNRMVSYFEFASPLFIIRCLDYPNQLGGGTVAFKSLCTATSFLEGQVCMCVCLYVSVCVYVCVCVCVCRLISITASIRHKTLCFIDWLILLTDWWMDRIIDYCFSGVNYEEAKKLFSILGPLVEEYNSTSFPLLCYLSNHLHGCRWFPALSHICIWDI